MKHNGRQRKRPTGNALLTYDQRIERYRTAKRMRDEGKMLGEIAGALGVSEERVRQILAKPPKPIGRPISTMDRTKIAGRLKHWHNMLSAAVAMQDKEREAEARARIETFQRRLDEYDAQGVTNPA